MIRVAVLAESPVDAQVALEIVRHLRGEGIAHVRVPLRARGVESVLSRVDSLVRHCRFHTDADALIVLVDGDLTEPHDAVRHAATPEPACRWCGIDAAARRALAETTDAGPGLRLGVAVGVAVPALEAWLLAARTSAPTEASWRVERTEGRFQGVRKQLKIEAFGSTHVTDEQAARVAVARIREGLESGALLQGFPGGYGPLDAAIRAW